MRIFILRTIKAVIHLDHRSYMMFNWRFAERKKIVLRLWMRVVHRKRKSSARVCTKMHKIRKKISKALNVQPR